MQFADTYLLDDLHIYKSDSNRTKSGLWSDYLYGIKSYIGIVEFVKRVSPFKIRCVTVTYMYEEGG